jgi:4-hydroxybenzoate polyprenyltransferase
MTELNSDKQATRTLNGAWLWNRLQEYALLMRLDKPVGIVLLLWPTLWALWIAARGFPDTQVLTVFLAGVLLMRSAGCVINDLADRNFDPHVDRTRSRPIASGRVSPPEALVLFCALALIAFGAVLTLNWLTIGLSVVGALLAASYPFAKRYTHLPQVHLGFAFGWSIPMAFAAQTGTVPGIAWLLLVANVLWSVAYDTMYALVDREDDLKVGVKSTAILFGTADRIIIAAIQIAMLGLLLLIGSLQSMGTVYYIGLLASVIYGGFQQWLIKDRDRQQCFRAFKNNVWLGAAIFAGIAAHFALGV